MIQLPLKVRLNCKANMVGKRMTFSEELKNKFKNFVTSRCGLYFRDYDLRSLEDAVTARMQSCGFDSALAYHNYLTTSEKKEDEFRELLNLLIVNHTYFFRNEPHFRALREKVLPEIIKNKRAERHLLGDRKGIQSNGKPKIRIWSAGCSTGEEPYSIAMVIRDLMGDLNEWDVEIYATDVSTHALEKAKTGVYGKNSMGLVNKEYEKKDEVYKDVPVVIVTTRESDEDKRRGLDAGAEAYILKSEFTTEGLLDAIERLIG